MEVTEFGICADGRFLLPVSHNQRDCLHRRSPNVQPRLCPPEDRRAELKCQWEAFQKAPDCSDHTATTANVLPKGHL